MDNTNAIVSGVAIELIRIDYPEITPDRLQEIPRDAMRYLTERAGGLNHIDAMKEINISPIMVVVWQRTFPEFLSAMNLIKQAEALELEAYLWEYAKNPTASNERMFALKSRLKEYREDGGGANLNNVNLKITLAGSDFDISSSVKTKEVFENDSFERS